MGRGMRVRFTQSYSRRQSVFSTGVVLAVYRDTADVLTPDGKVLIVNVDDMAILA